MKIFASNQFTPIKSLTKTAKIAAMTLPIMAAAESCSPWLYPPPPCPPYPHYHPIPHPHRHPHFRFFGDTQQKDTIQFNDVFELNKNDIAYIDNKNELKDSNN